MKRIPVKKPNSRNYRYALVDDDDYQKLVMHKWYETRPSSKSGTTYARRNNWDGGKNKRVLMHREILDAKLGEIIDHIDGNTLNNQKANIRICEHGANVQRYKRNRGGRFIGVYRSNPKKGYSEQISWYARITFRKESIILGTFESDIGAAMAYDKAADEYYGKHALKNF